MSVQSSKDISINVRLSETQHLNNLNHERRINAVWEHLAEEIRKEEVRKKANDPEFREFCRRKELADWEALSTLVL